MDVIKKAQNEQGRFTELCQDIYPLIKQIAERAEDHGFPGLFSLTASGDGYIHFNVHGSEWLFLKLAGRKPTIRLEAEIVLEMEES